MQFDGLQQIDEEVPLAPYIPKSLEQSLEILVAYGLDELLSVEDDPLLWATAVVYAWEFPRNPQANISEYYFQVAIPLPDCNENQIKEWRLYEEEGRVRARTWTEKEKQTDILKQMYDLVLEQRLEPASTTICVSHPSATTTKAIVSTGYVVRGGLGGTGHWGEWVRRPDGSWVPHKVLGGYIC